MKVIKLLQFIKLSQYIIYIHEEIYSLYSITFGIGRC